MNKRFLYVLLGALCFIAYLPSCIEDDSYGDSLEVYNKGDNRRNGEKQEEEDDEDDDDSDDTKDDDTFDFTTLSGTYRGFLTADEEATEESEGDTVDVTVIGNSDKTFKLALYNATVTGIELGDLIFDKIPSKYDSSSDMYTFELKKVHVDLAGGEISTDVDVSGYVTKKGKLRFQVDIYTPTLSLYCEGPKKQ